MKVTMIGHSTVLIEAAGMKILTDPYFGTWGNLAYKRIAPPFKSREEMAAVDLVLVSHNHWDHTDPGLLSRLLRPMFPWLRGARRPGSPAPREQRMWPAWRDGSSGSLAQLA